MARKDHQLYREIFALLASSAADFPRLVELFNSEILPRAIEKLNADFCPNLIGRLPEERLPTNERNLTDARTRIGVLLEYALATQITHDWDTLLRGHYKMTFVVANRYPDLIVRDHKHKPLVRLEVKVLEGVSEEKAANFDSMIRDVKPDMDIICNLLWSWEAVTKSGITIFYPRIHAGYAFDAYIIARVRDLGWLNTIRTRTKLIDVGGPLVDSGTGFKEEEHNMGKLMRIASPEMLRESALQPFRNHPSVIRYQQFRIYALLIGFDGVARSLIYGSEFVPRGDPIIENDENYFIEAVKNGRQLIVMGTRRKLQSAAIRQAIEKKAHACLVLALNEKFRWVLYDYSNGNVTELDSGSKPGAAIEPLRRASR